MALLMRTSSARLLAVAAVSALAAVAGSAHAQSTCPAGVSHPGEAWPDVSAQVLSQKAEAITALEDYAFTLEGADEERRGIRTDGVVIIRAGELIYERYARGHDASKRHLSWSVSKSFTNALVGIAVGQGRLSVEDSLCKHLPWVSELGEDRCGITVRHLLEFSSGLDWQEVYEGASNQSSSVLSMLYGAGHEDAARFIASHALRDPPGESWMYSSGDSTLLMAVVQAVMEPEHGDRFPWTQLLDPIGMRSAVWERDRAGTIIGSSYLYATPRDLARFGYLLKHDGCWDGARILPEGWVSESTQVSEAMTKKRLHRDPDDVQGRQFWLNKPVPGVDDQRPFPDLPEDAFFARGHWGQSISVIPSWDLVVGRTGDDREGGFDLQRFLVLAREVAAP